MPRMMTEARVVCADGRSQSDQYSSVATAILNGWRPLRSCRNFGRRTSNRPESRQDERQRGKVHVIRNARNSVRYRPDARGRTDLNEKTTLPWLHSVRGLPWKFILHHV